MLYFYELGLLARPPLASGQLLAAGFAGVPEPSVESVSERRYLVERRIERRTRLQAAGF